jgi:hypothetical protein
MREVISCDNKQNQNYTKKSQSILHMIIRSQKEGEIASAYKERKQLTAMYQQPAHGPSGTPATVEMRSNQ